MNFSSVIKQLRKSNGLTVSEYAYKLGVSTHAIYMIENRNIHPSINLLYAISVNSGYPIGILYMMALEPSDDLSYQYKSNNQKHDIEKKIKSIHHILTKFNN